MDISIETSKLIEKNQIFRRISKIGRISLDKNK